MIEQMKRGMEVAFKPPENAYSAFSRQAQVSGLSGILEGWNGTQARVRFREFGHPVRVNVNVDYLYDDNARQPDELFRTSTETLQHYSKVV